MEQKDKDFLRKLLATFKVEAEEHVRNMSSGLMELEKASTPETKMGVIEAVFREAHSLKGAARAVNAVPIERICQSLESVFSALKRHDLAPAPPLFNVLHDAIDAVGTLVSSAGDEQTPAERPGITEITQNLEAALRGGLPSPGPTRSRKSEGQKAPISRPAPDQPPANPVDVPPLSASKLILSETVRISTVKLDSLMRQAEELLSAKLTEGQRAAELREAGAALAEWEKKRTKIHPEVRSLLASLAGNSKGNGPSGAPSRREKNLGQMETVLAFVEWSDTALQSIKGKIAMLAKSAEQDQRVLGGMVDTLLEDMKRVLMLPFSSLLEAFPKLVRDLSRDLDKGVELEIQGGEIEIDRRILEEIKDPLIHLVRNCIDHGIESPKERERKKKPPRGRITITVTPQNGDKVEVLVADDGAGINLAKVRASVVRLGMISQEEAEKMNEQDILSLIFQSGVSTSAFITDLSGRGLGLAIVREKVERLGGVVSLETHSDVGTTFRMVLPLTLATFRGVLVRVEDQLFVLPTIYVERAMSLSPKDVKTVENRETLQFNGQALSLVRLGDALGLPRKIGTGGDAEKIHAMILNSAEKRIAFLVDEILNEQEVLVKRLGRRLSHVPNVAGATVLGTGKVAPIVNVPELMKSAVTFSPSVSAEVPATEARTKQKSILVAEDSITARALLKNILESAGYRVKTAVDGIDAFTTLRTEEFDLLVSDVDMPRMSGFDLTAKVRTDQKLSELPVVLVTALESREDRERGIDVGANAYIVKSSFEQSNLLEVVRRLI